MHTFHTGAGSASPSWPPCPPQGLDAVDPGANHSHHSGLITTSWCRTSQWADGAPTPWAEAIAQANARFNQLKKVRDPDTGNLTLVFSGAHVKLSGLLAHSANARGEQITVYADTLVADLPSFNVPKVVIMARRLDVRSLRCPLLFLPQQGVPYSTAELTLDEIAGGPLELATDLPASLEKLAHLPLYAPRGMRASLVSVGEQGLQIHGRHVPASPASQLASPGALNSLCASLNLAHALALHSATHAEAWKRVRWVRNCLGTIERAQARHGQAMSPAQQKLQQAASALAIQLNPQAQSPSPAPLAAAPPWP
jgi:hypothetical protein